MSYIHLKVALPGNFTQREADQYVYHWATHLLPGAAYVVTYEYVTHEGYGALSEMRRSIDGSMTFDHEERW